MRLKNLAAAAACMVTILGVLITCSENPSSPKYDRDYLSNVTLVPDSGPPGTPVLLQGLSCLPDENEWHIYIDTIPSPLIANDSMSYLTAVPLLYSPADSSWPTAPSEPVSVVLYCDGVPIDSITGVLTVEELPRVDATMDSVIQRLTGGVSSLKEIVGWSHPADSQMQVLLSALDEILVTGENSLTAFLEGRACLLPCDSVPAELMSAVCRSSGLDSLLGIWAANLRLLNDAMQAKSALDRSDLMAIYDGEDLAFEMQLQALLKEFGSTFVGETNSTWSDVTTILGLIGVVAPLPRIAQLIVEVASFILNVADFVINKILIGVLPAELTDLSLDFQDHTVGNGDSTWSIVHISAKNQPTNIGVQDIISQVLNFASFTNWATSNGIPRSLMTDQELIDDIIEGLTTWMLGVIRSIQAAMGLPDLTGQLPDMSWDSLRVYNPELVDLVSHDPNLFTPINSSLNWLASGTNVGMGKLSVRTAGPNGWVHPTLASLGYHGGTFGDEMLSSNVDSVRVAPALYLTIDFPSSIDSGGSGELTARAGYEQGGGVTYTSGISVIVSVDGGSASPSAGGTDDGGYFETVIHHDNSSAEIEITVTAMGLQGSYAYRQISADVVGGDIIGCIGKVARFTAPNNCTYYVKYRPVYVNGEPDYSQVHVDFAAVYQVHDSTKWWRTSWMWPWVDEDVPWNGSGFIFHVDSIVPHYGSYYRNCFDITMIYSEHPDTCGCEAVVWERDYLGPGIEFPYGPCE